jgi:hypothetical protein
VRRDSTHIFSDCAATPFNRCMMTSRIFERRRLLQGLALAPLAMSSATLAACARGAGAQRPPNFRSGGGNRHDDKGGSRGNRGGGNR